MEIGDQESVPVKAKVALIDPDTMSVLWTNEPLPATAADGVTIEQAVPMAEALGVQAALREAAATGVAQNLRTAVVSTTRGSITLAASVYRLPDGKLLVVTENAWQTRGAPDPGAPRRSGRRTR